MKVLCPECGSIDHGVISYDLYLHPSERGYPNMISTIDIKCRKCGKPVFRHLEKRPMKE